MMFWVALGALVMGCFIGFSFAHVSLQINAGELFVAGYNKGREIERIACTCGKESCK